MHQPWIRATSVIEIGSVSVNVSGVALHHSPRNSHQSVTVNVIASVTTTAAACASRVVMSVVTTVAMTVTAVTVIVIANEIATLTRPVIRRLSRWDDQVALIALVPPMAVTSLLVIEVVVQAKRKVLVLVAVLPLRAMSACWVMVAACEVRISHNNSSCRRRELCLLLVVKMAMATTVSLCTIATRHRSTPRIWRDVALVVWLHHQHHLLLSSR